MAPRLSLLLLFSLLSLLAVDARPGHPFHPCNTLIISTYSFSLRPLNNPNNPNNLHSFLRHPDFIAVVAADLRPDFLPSHHSLRLPHHHHHQQPQNPQILGFSSFKDRTKDILSVVASLLFGAACGALTAGTMYLIWSLFNFRHGSYHGFTSDDDSNDDDDDDDIFNPKKPLGYVSIPAGPPAPAPAPADSAAPAPAPAAKETV